MEQTGIKWRFKMSTTEEDLYFDRRISTHYWLTKCPECKSSPIQEVQEIDDVSFGPGHEGPAYAVQCRCGYGGPVCATILNAVDAWHTDCKENA